MSVAEKKEFVIKHVFYAIVQRGAWSYGEKKVHFDFPWRIKIFNANGVFYINLECMKDCGVDESIDATVNMKLFGKTGEESFMNSFKFSRASSCHELKIMGSMELENFLVNGSLTVECHVTITKMSGFKGKLNNLHESSDEFTDAVLIVNGEKFHVCKKYLAYHSSYFKSLFSGNFDESKQSEITLKDIDPYDFHNFLDVLHGEPAVDESTVEGILKLADMYDSKTAIRRCEEFFLKMSKQSLKVKFDAAIKYKMDKLKEKCFSEMKSAADIDGVIPEDDKQFDTSVWKELLKKSLSFSRY